MQSCPSVKGKEFFLEDSVFRYFFCKNSLCPVEENFHFFTFFHIMSRDNFFTMKFHLDNLVTEYENLESELSDPEIFSDIKRLKTVNQKKKNLEKTVELYKAYKQLYANYNEAKTLVVNEKDPEMLELMKLEIAESEAKIPLLEEELKIALLPKDPNDEKNIILEIRAGVGGDEAGLFALELAESYKNFSKSEGFNAEIVSESWNDAGGYKEVIFEIKGE